MPHQNCVACNANDIVAIGAVSFTESVLVEHRCLRCGHIFYIGDRRSSNPQSIAVESKW